MTYHYESHELETIQEVLDVLNAINERGFEIHFGIFFIATTETFVGQVTYDNKRRAWVYIDGKK